MKKSKKFIKFKDYIIKLPNSMGLIGTKHQINNHLNMNNDIGPFVEPPNSPSRNDVEGPEVSNALANPNIIDSNYQNGYGSFGLSQSQHPNFRIRDKGYSIYVVDDEHEIHRFDIDTYEWSIISTTKDF